MKQKVKKVLSHPLIYGSSLVVSGNLVANFFNFLFNLFMKRNLSEAEYGVLATVISLIGLPALIGTAVVPLVVRYASNYFATEELHKARGLYMKIAQFFLILDIAFFVIFLVFIPQLGKFFHITDTTILIVTDAIIFLVVMGVINMAFLQAKLVFLFQTIITISASLIKLFFGILFFFTGFAALGGALALLISSFFGYAASFVPLRFIFDRKLSSPHVESRELFAYGIPSSLQLIGLTSLISADIILVKHFFSPSMAGVYAGLSLIGRVIFYLSAPIGTVMFPLIVQKASRKENITNTFFLSLLLIVVPSLCLTVFYFLFPTFTVLFFTGKKEDLVIAPLLGLFGIFISLYSVLTIICNFYLSIKKTKTFLPIIFGALAQIVLINLFHQTFLQIILISIVITSFLIIGLLLYYPFVIKSTLQE